MILSSFTAEKLGIWFLVLGSSAAKVFFFSLVLDDFIDMSWERPGCAICLNGQNLVSKIRSNFWVRLSGDVGLNVINMLMIPSQHCLSVPSTPKETVGSLNQHLGEVMGWMRADKVTLNLNKTEVLTMEQDQLWEVVLCRGDLGLHSPEHLAFQHGSWPVTGASGGGCGQGSLLTVEAGVCQLWLFLENKVLAIVTHLLVTSWLDYGNAQSQGLRFEDTWTLQLVQNGTSCVQLNQP